eukprot:scaffold45611_cov199-Amphora_coffeaeformis.AAC.1
MQGLRNLHDKGICHHDLSPENCMIHQGHAYIIDFGMALRVPYNDQQQRCLVKRQGAYGKLHYMSQEVYQDKDFDSEAIDVWSAGTMLWCMVTGYCSYQIPQRTDGLFYHMTTRGCWPKFSLLRVVPKHVLEATTRYGTTVVGVEVRANRKRALPVALRHGDFIAVAWAHRFQGNACLLDIRFGLIQLIPRGNQLRSSLSLLDTRCLPVCLGFEIRPKEAIHPLELIGSNRILNLELLQVPCCGTWLCTPGISRSGGQLRIDILGVNLAEAGNGIAGLDGIAFKNLPRLYPARNSSMDGLGAIGRIERGNGALGPEVLSPGHEHHDHLVPVVTGKAQLTERLMVRPVPLSESISYTMGEVEQSQSTMQVWAKHRLPGVYHLFQ